MKSYLQIYTAIIATVINKTRNTTKKYKLEIQLSEKRREKKNLNENKATRIISKIFTYKKIVIIITKTQAFNILTHP